MIIEIFRNYEISNNSNFEICNTTHGLVQEYWLVGLIRCQVAAECLSTYWLFAMGLALQLG